MVGIKVSKTNIHIEDSYAISKREFKKYILYAFDSNPEYKRRSVFALQMEWTVHNFLYRVNYKRAQTKSVDLNDQPLYMTILYCILGCLVWLFIR